MRTNVIVTLMVIAFAMISCKFSENSSDTAATVEVEAKEFTSSHVFTATFEGAEFHTCQGMTSLCPDRCGHSGNLASFKVNDYKELIVNGEAGREKLKDYFILISDYHKNDLDKPYVPLIKKLKRGEEVEIFVDFVYDTTKDAIQTIENIISIKKI